MNFITENRPDMIESLKNIKPRKIISFSSVDIKTLKNFNLMVIMNRQQFRNHPFDIPSSWTVRFNNRIHSKLAIGLNGFIIGSWNFSDNSSNNMHECILQVNHKEAPHLQKLIANYFEKIWARSSYP